MCDFCEHRKAITKGSCVGLFELVVSGQELEISYFCNDWNYDNRDRMNIEYCPMCGRKLGD